MKLKKVETKEELRFFKDYLIVVDGELRLAWYTDKKERFEADFDSYDFEDALEIYEIEGAPE